MKKVVVSQWTVTALVAAVAVLATLLVCQAFQSRPGVAWAQSEGVSANYMIGLLGPLNNDRMPVVLVDTKSQVIMVYEYIDSQRRLLYRVGRAYSSDREVTDGRFYDNAKPYDGPSVQDVQNYLRRGSGRSGGTY